MNCYFSERSATNHFGGESSTNNNTGVGAPGLSGTALMTQPAGGNMSLRCNVQGAANWVAGITEPIRITAVPIAGVINKGAPTIP